VGRPLGSIFVFLENFLQLVAEATVAGLEWCRHSSPFLVRGNCMRSKQLDAGYRELDHAAF
jgi:hypothetical protein